jgi:hypothetical protein
MACCSQVRRRSFSNSARANLTNRVEVLGTWDFKWSLGTQIRVAFQRPRSDDVSDKDFGEACEEIRSLAQTWLTSAAMVAAPNIGFRWVDVEFAPSDDTDPQNGSPFEDPDERTYLERDYDVLVSLDALPLGKRDPRTLSRTQRIVLPTSELGSFARRLDYGVPSMYVGPFAGVGGSLPEYYRTNSIARYYVIHEFGHVLGLAHAHQSPVYRESLAQQHPQVDKALKDIVTLAAELQQLRGLTDPGEQLVERELAVRDELRRALASIKAKLKSFLLSRQIALTLTESELDDFVVAQIVDAWPGNRAFSDWPAAVSRSIMDIPYYECLVGIHTEHSPCKHCEIVFEQGKPFDDDLKFLRQLYPRAES